MHWWRRMRATWRPGFSRDLSEELRHHDAMLRAEGHSAAQAARQLGNDLRLRGESRDAWGWVWLDRLGQDVRIGLRQMRRAPGFTALAVLILGLGIGSNTALYSVMDAVFLHPLPYRDAGRLVYVQGLPPSGTPVTSFTATARAEPGEVNFAGGADALRIKAAEVTPNFFSFLGLEPVQGRSFLPEEQVPGKDHVAVLSAALAQQLGGGVLGRSVRINGAEMTVVGVMPPGFDFPSQSQLWLPLPRPWSFQAELISSNIIFWNDYAHLRPGVSANDAKQELVTLAQRRGTHLTRSEAEDATLVMPLRAFLEGQATSGMFWLLLGAVGVVLLIACADVAGLQLTRAVARQQEIVIRAALGASQTRLLRQNLTESLLLVALGGAAGALLAWVGLPALRALLPQSFWLAAPLRLNGRVLALTAGAALASGVIFGLFPALHACRVELRQSAEGATPERGWLRRARSGLAIAQVALAVLLLVGAGLLLVSLTRLTSASTGFRPERLVSFKVNLGGAAYNTEGAGARFYDQAQARIAALPGVSGAALTSQMPFAIQPFMILGLTREEPAAQAETKPPSVFSSVGNDYFGVLGIPLLAGRVFAPRDAAKSPHVVIINRTLAAALWPGQSPVGKHVAGLSRPRNGNPDWWEVVGEVGDTARVLGQPPRGIVYLPLSQAPSPSAYMVVRTAFTAAQLAPEFRAAVASVDANIPVSDIATEQQRIAASIGAPRFRTILLSLFALLALGLSAGGIFGSLAYWAARRTPEIGVRMALGAHRGQVLRLVMGQGLRLVAWGLGLGLAGALALGQTLQHFLYRVAPRDPLVLSLATAAMCSAGLVACYLPARRAARLDPLQALRRE